MLLCFPRWRIWHQLLTITVCSQSNVYRFSENLECIVLRISLYLCIVRLNIVFFVVLLLCLVFLVLTSFVLSVLKWCSGPMEVVQRIQGVGTFAPFFQDFYFNIAQSSTAIFKNCAFQHQAVNIRSTSCENDAVL